MVLSNFLRHGGGTGCLEGSLNVTCLRLEGVSMTVVMLLIRSLKTDLVQFCGETCVDSADSAGDCEDGISRTRRFSGVERRLNLDLADFCDPCA